MHEPAVLFLDEPTSGVDPLTRREFWSHINAMVERGVTVMVTTHFLDEAEYCDRIGLVYRGHVIAEGSPDELKDAARTDDRARADAGGRLHRAGRSVRPRKEATMNARGLSRSGRLRRIAGLVRKETLQIVRDPSSFLIAGVLPLLLLFIFGYGVSLDLRRVPGRRWWSSSRRPRPTACSPRSATRATSTSGSRGTAREVEDDLVSGRLKADRRAGGRLRRAARPRRDGARCRSSSTAAIRTPPGLVAELRAGRLGQLARAGGRRRAAAWRRGRAPAPPDRGRAALLVQPRDRQPATS